MQTLRALLPMLGIACGCSAAVAQVVECDLNVGSYGAGGTCVLADEAVIPSGGPRKQLAFFWPQDAVRIVITSKPADPPPWRGVFILAERHVTFEIARERVGTRGERLVLRNPWSWVTVYDWREVGASSGATLGRAYLEFDLTRFPPASSDDIAILEAALHGLEDPGSWDREDDRDCGNDAPEHASLFCLLVRGVEDRMGQYHHRQPALELVRAVINDKWPDRLTSHPLMDFNNHPRTTMGDLRAALEAALSQAAAEAAAHK